MHVEAWAPLYHEPLVHLPIAFQKRPVSVLILGGGSFFAAHEVLKYKSIKRVLMVEHDDAVMELTRKYYSHARKCLADPRLEVRCCDAYRFEMTSTEKFDLVVNDGVDLLSLVGHKAISSPFERMADLLTPTGICSDVIDRHLFERSWIAKTIKEVTSRHRVSVSILPIPEYPGTLHALVLWGRDKQLSQELKRPVNLEQRKWIDSPQSNPCSYYDPRQLSHYLFLPPYAQRLLAR